jgi:hypothetical protein
MIKWKRSKDGIYEATIEGVDCRVFRKDKDIWIAQIGSDQAVAFDRGQAISFCQDNAGTTKLERQLKLRKALAEWVPSDLRSQD